MWNTFFKNEILELSRQGLERNLNIISESVDGIAGNGNYTVNFSTNDYLGLARDNRLKSAAIQAVNDFGCGARASRLLAGHLKLHEELENDIAKMMGTETALVFGSGFLTNLGVISSIAGPGDVIFSDLLNHASLIDGIRLSRAHCERFQHRDMKHLENLLKTTITRGRRIIISESIFSMDGDIAPIGALTDIARQFDAMLIIDEAHAIGVMGKKGGGVCRAGVKEFKPDVIIGTLSKALGGYGGFVACSHTMRQFLINKARTFIFSTGLPPACAASARTAISIVRDHPEMGEALQERTRWFCERLTSSGLNVPNCESHILPILIGNNEATSSFAQRLQENGLLIMPIRPPTVPVGTSRVRLSLSLTMSREILQKASEVIAGVARSEGLIK